MRWRDIKESFLEFWHKFKQEKYGIIGVVFFGLFILLILCESLIIPFPEADSRWRDVTYWQNNPKGAEPIWVNWFTSQDRAEHKILDSPKVLEKDRSKMKIMNLIFDYNYEDELPPKDLIFKALAKGNIMMSIELERPDGNKVQLSRISINNSNEKEVVVSLNNKGSSTAYDFIKKYDTAENIQSLSRDTIRPMNIFFSQVQEGMYVQPTPLKGTYKIKISAIVMGKDSILENPSLTIAGRVFGLLGTDNSKRDIWSGIIAGVKWAMLLGLLTSCISVTIGVIYGVTSAYFGGWVDALIMRIFEIFTSIPLLPVLIVMSAIFKPSIWILMIMMSLFFWVGSVRTVRSIALQIKEETYIEAAYALDASDSRIIFKHMISQVVPYSFASMALMVPSAIIYEATISLIGLGDATIVTWGQILHGAMSSGAVLQGLWWWVIPPGIFIAMMGMTFAFLGFTMDTILNPKLKKR
ncbi:ABC transporter permease [Orenia metallireducens]|uniref:ABC transporter permease n=1 Tax=Orenia metallireducens TaxID=1413210 RepID=A0A1C0AAR5_9FIRM|nr:ABC transporter permease [Orenia metallireducens]OCL27371.1 ABC transporter permease [Orenia metallireducens]